MLQSMNKAVLILIAVLIHGCKTDDSDIRIIYDTVYNYIGQDDNSNISKMANNGKIVLVDSIESVESIYINSPNCNSELFTQNDICFMVGQNSSQFKYDLQNDSMNNIYLLPTDSLRKQLDINTFNNVFFTISKPLFSQNHKRVLISIDFYCPECGLGKLLILTKIGKDWKIEKVCETWIS